jgi:hypothetical protein
MGSGVALIGVAGGANGLTGAGGKPNGLAGGGGGAKGLTGTGGGGGGAGWADAEGAPITIAAISPAADMAAARVRAVRFGMLYLQSRTRSSVAQGTRRGRFRGVDLPF